MSDKETNIFEKATRLKLRFDSPKGNLTIEDLWAIPLTSAVGAANLDDLARKLHEDLNGVGNVSFVRKLASPGDTVKQLKFDIVKYIIDTRVAEADEAAIARDKAAKKQKLLGILADREEESLKTLSAEDIKKQLAEL